MLAAGLATEAFPAWSGSLLLIVAYLVRVSGALGFSLWVWSQQYWSAVESGSINNTMLIETALLDVICFGRILDGWKWCGMLLAFLAITLLQIQGKRRR